MRVFRFSYGENMKNPCKTTEKSNHPAGRTVYRRKKLGVSIIDSIPHCHTENALKRGKSKKSGFVSIK